MVELSFRTRQAALERAKSEPVEVLVIGGGITGAGIAQDAISRGFKTLLIEKGDLAGGTSSKSSKLIHGGLRYLKEMQIGVTMTMIKERNLLVSLAPGLVKWIPFLVPIYPWTPAKALAIGLWLYDSIAGLEEERGHKKIASKDALALAPSLRAEGLKSASYYWDCLTNDARMVLTVIRSAASQGAEIANYTAFVDFLKSRRRICGVLARDQLTAQCFEILASRVVNATGVWIDQILAKDDPKHSPVLSQAKGIHIVVPQSKLRMNTAILFYSKEHSRALFAIPLQELVIVGTTDTFYQGDPEEPSADVQDVDYILNATRGTFRGSLRKKDLISTFAGLRPLLRQEKGTASDLSRRHAVFESESGLITVGGGKLTTYREIAKETLDLIGARLHRRNRCVTARIPLLRSTLDFDDMHLQDAYGDDSQEILHIIEQNPEMGTRLVRDLPYLKAEVLFSVRYEMAMTLADVLSRRTRIVWQDRNHGIGCAEEVARIMAQEMAWSKEKIRHELKAYQKEVQLHRVP